MNHRISVVHLMSRSCKFFRHQMNNGNRLHCIPFNTTLWKDHRRFKHDLTMKKIETQSNETLIDYAQHICKELETSHNNMSEISKATKKLYSNITRILFQLYERNDSNFIRFYEQVQNYDIPTMSNLDFIAMKYYADKMNFEKAFKLLNMLKGNKDFKCNPKHYYPCILLGLKLGEMDKCKDLLDEMALITKPPFEGNKFHVMINLCAERYVENKDAETVIFVNKVLDILATYYVTMDRNLVEAILNWFKLEKSSIKEFKINNQNKHCIHCTHEVKPFKLSDERLISLKKNLSLVVKAGMYLKVSKIKKQLAKLDSIMKSVNENEIQTLSRLKKHLENSKDFDVVIDSLNVGHNSVKRFDINIVRHAAYHFREQGKRVLIICAGPLQQNLLTDKANLRGGKLKHTRNVLQELQTFTSLFFVGKDPVDDHCILYSIIHHDFNIELVTDDYFYDHMHALDLENQFDYKNWQASNQHFVDGFTSKGIPVFKEPCYVHMALQQHPNGWHVPLNEDDWYCIRPTKDINWLLNVLCFYLAPGLELSLGKGTFS